MQNNASAVAEPGPEMERLSRLAAAIADFPGHRFAVVDGGLFEDLPLLLMQYRLRARSLFLDRADGDVQAAGPWLIDLDQSPDATKRVLALPSSKPAMTFWSCGAGEVSLFRH